MTTRQSRLLPLCWRIRSSTIYLLLKAQEATEGVFRRPRYLELVEGGHRFWLGYFNDSAVGKESVEILFVTRVTQLSLYARGPNDRRMAEPHDH